MKCPKCGAPSNVLATRVHQTVFLRRSRRCYNGHRFAALEVYESCANPVAMKSAAVGVEARKKLYAIKRKIWAMAGEKARVVAHQLGVDQKWVYAVRKQKP